MPGVRHVVALRLDAARDLHVEQQSPPPLPCTSAPNAASQPARSMHRLHADAREAAIEALEMLVDAIGAAAVDRQHLVDGVAEQEAAVERRDARLRRAAAAGHRAR